MLVYFRGPSYPSAKHSTDLSLTMSTQVMSSSTTLSPLPSESPGSTPGDHNAQLEVAELQEIASRQQHQIELQQRDLMEKEKRVNQLRLQEERHRLARSSTGSVMTQEQLRDMQLRVAQQEERLRKMRALKGQVEQFRANNDTLNHELEDVKRRFSMKEKELSSAMQKVEELLQQMQQQQRPKNGLSRHVTAELAEKMRHKGSSSNSDIDRRIADLRQRVLRTRNTSESPGSPDKPNGTLSGSKDDLALLQPHPQQSSFDKSDPKYQSVPLEGESVRSFIQRQSGPPGQSESSESSSVSSSRGQFRYAPRSVITDTYTKRMGKETLERYKKNAAELLRTRLARLSQLQQDPPGAPPSSTTTDLNESLPTLSAALAGVELVDKPSTRVVTTPRAVHRKHSGEEMDLALQLPWLRQKIDLSGTTEDEVFSESPVEKFSESTVEPVEVDSVDEGPESKSNTLLRVQEPPQPTRSCLRSTPNTPGGTRSSRKVRFDPLAVLLDAALEGEVELVKDCVSRVSDVSAANDEGITALHNSICAGHEAVVKLLLTAGADVNAADADGWTPLHCAASCNSLPMVRLLVEHGAALFARTLSDQETPLDKCEEEEDTQCAEYLYSCQEKLGIRDGGRCYALYAYRAHNLDELGFVVNEALSVIKKGDEDELEWYWASNRLDRKGYVPRNFLGLYPRVLPASKHQLQRMNESTTHSQ